MKLRQFKGACSKYCLNKHMPEENTLICKELSVKHGTVENYSSMID